MVAWLLLAAHKKVRSRYFESSDHGYAERAPEPPRPEKGTPKKFTRSPLDPAHIRHPPTPGFLTTVFCLRDDI